MILDGKETAKKIRVKLKKEIESLDFIPSLAVILVGENPASHIYVRLKKKACKEIGMNSVEYKLEKEADEADVLKLIDELNSNEKIHGILVQLPLPKHMDEKKILESIIPKKDVDGFTCTNAGKLMLGQNSLFPCTPSGIMRLLDKYSIDSEGKHAVIVGRSNIVGKPIALLLLQKNATVTICHSRTKNLSEITKQADIIVAAVGKPKLITKEMVKPNSIIIDVGINRLEDGKIVGDVDFEDVNEIVSYITPVPGGIGPMTIAMLLSNTLWAAKNS